MVIRGSSKAEERWEPHIVRTRVEGTRWYIEKGGAEPSKFGVVQELTSKGVCP